MRRIVFAMVISFSIFVFSLAMWNEKSDLDTILGKDSAPKLLGKQFRFTEGPLWLPEKQIFIFSDIPANKMYQYSPQQGFAIFRDPSNFSNGNALDIAGNLITAQHDRTITRTDKQGNISVIASKYQGKKLNSPNDLVVASNGDIYFTDPHFGLISYGPQKAPEEQPVRGIYRLTTKGKVQLLSGDIAIPNGLAFSPQGNVLYVTNSAGGTIHCFDVNTDGTLANLRLFAKQPAKPGQRPVGDGIKVDSEGNVYAAAPGGVAIYTSTGELIGEIILPQSAANLAWGGANYKLLLITSHHEIYMLKTLISGNK